MTAAEQYAPSKNPDDSDDCIRQHKAWVAELRNVRERLENLFTGIL